MAHTAVAIIPARGGSKRIFRKNIKPFCGQPLIGWPIGEALSSGQFSQVVVSTDDGEIADVARQYHAQTPFIRDAALADDHSGTSPVIVDAIEKLKLADDCIVACIYPTAVFVTADVIRQGISHLAVAGSDTKWALTVCEYPAPIQRAYMNTSGGLKPVNPDMMPMRSQDLPARYFDAGQVYFARASTWLTLGAHVWDGAQGIVLSSTQCVDIDTPDDWQRAEMIFSLQN